MQLRCSRRLKKDPAAQLCSLLLLCCCLFTDTHQILVFLVRNSDSSMSKTASYSSRIWCLKRTSTGSGDDRGLFAAPGGNNLNTHRLLRILCIFRKEFEQLCRQEVKIPGLVMMRDVVISKSEFVADQKAVSKIQDFQEDPDLFRYCALPQVHRYSLKASLLI